MFRFQRWWAVLFQRLTLFVLNIKCLDFKGGELFCSNPLTLFVLNIRCLDFKGGELFCSNPLNLFAMNIRFLDFIGGELFCFIPLTLFVLNIRCLNIQYSVQKVSKGWNKTAHHLEIYYFIPTL